MPTEEELKEDEVIPGEEGWTNMGPGKGRTRTPEEEEAHRKEIEKLRQEREIRIEEGGKLRREKERGIQEKVLRHKFYEGAINTTINKL